MTTQTESVADAIVELLGPFHDNSPLNAAKTEALLQCPVASPCGSDCMETINAAVKFLNTLPDCNNRECEQIIAACVRQCEVYYLG